MKTMKKILTMMLAVMLLVAVSPADTKAATVTAGSKVTVKLSFTDVYGIQGTLVFSNPDILTNISISIESENGGSESIYQNNFAFSPSGGNVASGAIVVTATVKSTAKVGDTCTISAKDVIYTDEDFNDVNGTLKAQKITVKAPSTNDNNGGNGGGNNGGDNNNGENNGGNTSIVDNTDYSKLKDQIAIAEGLIEDDYAGESWKVLQSALDNAYAALGCGNQSVVDTATQLLIDAMASLVQVDYSKLEDAIEAGNSLITGNKLGGLWEKLVNAIADGNGLLTSSDQEAVDAAAEEILSLIEQIKALLEAEKEVIVQTVEVEVEVEPKGEYCNITMHKVWPILFFISLAANIVLVVIIVLGKRKKGAPGDDTPVVDYDIAEDDE